MRIRWTPAASADLQQIGDYLKNHHPHFRQPTMRKLYDTIRALRTWPGRGRPGSEEGTREILFPPLPYIAVYRVTAQSIDVCASITPRRIAADWPIFRWENVSISKSDPIEVDQVLSKSYRFLVRRSRAARDFQILIVAVKPVAMNVTYSLLRTTRLTRRTGEQQGRQRRTSGTPWSYAASGNTSG